jgi:hypothetical protein
VGKKGTVVCEQANGIPHRAVPVERGGSRRVLENTTWERAPDARSITLSVVEPQFRIRVCAEKRCATRDIRYIDARKEEYG